MAENNNNILTVGSIVKMDLTIQHDEYLETQYARDTSRLLFDGIHALQKSGNIKDYLFEKKNESKNDYNLRVKRLLLDPWIDKIITARQALLFRKSIIRELISELKEYTENVDLKGTSIDSFMENQSKQAQIDGIRWILVDMPQRILDEQGNLKPLTALQEKQLNFRPFMECIPANVVIDWEFGEDKKLLWVVMELNIKMARSIENIGRKPEIRKQYKVWTRNYCVVYEKVKKGTQYDIMQNTKNDLITLPTQTNMDKEYKIISIQLNMLSEIPLVPLFGVKRSEASGDPICKNILQHVILLMNKNSVTDHFEEKAAHPVPYAISKKPPEKIDSWNGIWIPNTADASEHSIGQTQIGYLEPTGASFSVIKETIKDITYKILSISLAQNRKESSQVQSSDSQKEDRKIFSSSLYSTSLQIEETEIRCWNLMAKWLGKETGVVELTYSRDFDDKEIAVEMINSLRDLVTSYLLPKKTLWELLIKNEILPDDFDFDLAELEISNQINAESGINTGNIILGDENDEV